MNLYRSKCDTCGDGGYIFPNQIETIKNNDNLALHPYIKGLKIGSDWFCCKCDKAKKNPLNCKINANLTGTDANALIDIRSRETNMKDMGFILPD